MNRLFLLALLTGYAVLLPAQAIYGGQLEAGGQRINLAAFNDYASQEGYTAIKRLFPGAQFAFHTFGGRGNRWVIGGKACGYMVQQPASSGNNTLLSYTVLRYYYGTLHIGRVLWETRNDTRSLRLYPTLGGGYGVSLFRLEKSPYFSNYTGQGLLADASLNLSWFKPMPGDERNALLLSVSAGYQAGTAWHISPGGTALPTAPAGPYLRVGMGMSSTKR